MDMYKKQLPNIEEVIKKDVSDMTTEDADVIAGFIYRLGGMAATVFGEKRKKNKKRLTRIVSGLVKFFKKLDKMKHIPEPLTYAVLNPKFFPYSADKYGDENFVTLVRKLREYNERCYDKESDIKQFSYSCFDNFGINRPVVPYTLGYVSRGIKEDCPVLNYGDETTGLFEANLYYYAPVELRRIRELGCLEVLPDNRLSSRACSLVLRMKLFYVNAITGCPILLLREKPMITLYTDKSHIEFLDKVFQLDNTKILLDAIAYVKEKYGHTKMSYYSGANVIFESFSVNATQVVLRITNKTYDSCLTDTDMVVVLSNGSNPVSFIVEASQDKFVNEYELCGKYMFFPVIERLLEKEERKQDLIKELPDLDR